MTMSRGVLIVLSGPSGAGKGTVLARALELNQELRVSVSCTTRAPRVGEVDGVNYFFKTQDELERMIQNDQMLEYANVYGNIYGTSREFVEDTLDSGSSVILEIDVQGALNVKKIMPEAIMVFLMPKDKETLVQRLRGRGTESDEQLNVRLGKAEYEVSQAINYDYIVINNTVNQCCDDFLSIINAEKCRVANNKLIIQSFK